MVPYHVEGYRGDAAGLGPEPAEGGPDLRQLISHHVNAAVHMDAGDHLGRVVLFRVTAHKVGQQIARQRAVGEVGQMKMGKEIHAFWVPDTASCCSEGASALD